MRVLILALALLTQGVPAQREADGPPYNDSAYSLPWVAGEEHRVAQGNNSLAGTHQGQEAYAWDVSMPVGTLVLADRAGVISMTKDDSNVGGFDYFLGTAANYVVINHGDGRQTVYLHLMYHGVLVEPGQHVVQGQPVAFSGDTGFAGGPHLHFAVEVASSSERVTQSVPTYFADVKTWGGVPLAGRHYVSGNQQVRDAPSVTPIPSERRKNTFRNPFGLYQNKQDFPVMHGHFYMETHGASTNPRSGFLVADDDSMPFNLTLDAIGGPQTAGYPISQRFVFGGLTTQVFQKLVLQWHADTGQVLPLNVFDVLHDAGDDTVLEASRQIPPPDDDSADAGLTWTDVVTRHQALLDANAALKSAYFSVADPMSMYGLPMSSVTDEGNVLVVRCQRAVLQLWKVDVPWASAGQVTVVNGGDIAAQQGLFPASALVPDPAPIP